MEWPFNKIITIVLIHPDEKSKFHTLSTNETQKKKKNHQSLECFGKPDTDVNNGWGFSKFVALEKLHADGFIKNDILYIHTAMEWKLCFCLGERELWYFKIFCNSWVFVQLYLRTYIIAYGEFNLIFHFSIFCIPFRFFDFAATYLLQALLFHLVQ